MGIIRFSSGRCEAESRWFFGLEGGAYFPKCKRAEVAHRLAKLGLSLQGEHLWVEAYHPCIQPYVLAGQLSV